MKLKRVRLHDRKQGQPADEEGKLFLAAARDSLALDLGLNLCRSVSSRQV